MTKRASEMIAAHYAEFVGVAGRVLSRDAQALQMQPTDLAHEAAVRIAGFDRLNVTDQKHFLSLSARVMRQVLIDEIRRMRAQTPGAVGRDPMVGRSAWACWCRGAGRGFDKARRVFAGPRELGGTSVLHGDDFERDRRE